MRQARMKAAGWTGAAVLCAALAGCTGGETTGSAVTGVAQSDAPIQGTVSLNDSSPQSKKLTVATRADGTFSFDVEGLTPPYQLKVEWQDGAAPARLFAVSEANHSLDVNQLTDVAFGAAAGTTGADATFAQAAPEVRQETARKARNVLAALQTVLAPLFERYGITDPAKDRAEVRALLADVRIVRSDGVVTVTNRATGGVIFTGPLDDLASGTFNAANMPDGPGTPPVGTTCTAFTYSPWGACQPDGTQVRTVQSSSPSGCTGGSPVLSQACTYQPPVNTCTGFTYSDWAACQPGNTQTRTVLASTPVGCTGGSPVLSQACTYVPPVTTCSSFTYSAWGACQADSTQTRTVLTSSPAGCTGGSPVLSRACTYVPPACTYSYSAWSACSASGTQTRTVVSSSPAGCSGTPVLSQSCTPPTQSCTGCHGIPPTTGAHTFHQSRASCATCHGSGYSTTTVNSATHQNGVKNVASSIGWNATSRTCSNSCHGSKSW